MTRLHLSLRPAWKTNLAGAPAYPLKHKLNLAMRLLTATLQDSYYETSTSAAQEMIDAVLRLDDPLFAAKAALFARDRGGLRSGSHLVGAVIASTVKGQPWTAKFFERLIVRPDDAVRLMDWLLRRRRSRVPNAVKKGVGRALARFDAYQLAKYRRNHGKGLSLIDVVNLVHPPHTEALSQLVRGTLPPAATWEAALSVAGQLATDAGEMNKLKAAVWERLIVEDRLGYLALLRNLKTIALAVPHCANTIVERLVDEHRIRSSRVLPFQIAQALAAIEERRDEVPFGWAVLDGMPAKFQCHPQLLTALCDAAEISLGNVPRYDGSTLIALDVSGSMGGRPVRIGSLFAAMLMKTNQADLMLFSDDAVYTMLPPGQPVLRSAAWLEKAAGGGTNFHAIFKRAARAYDRIIILSDMQAWIGNATPDRSLQDYERTFACRPKIICFDLAGYGTGQFPRDRVFQLAGFTDASLEVMRELEDGPEALVRKIESVAI